MFVFTGSRVVLQNGTNPVMQSDELLDSVCIKIHPSETPFQHNKPVSLRVSPFRQYFSLIRFLKKTQKKKKNLLQPRLCIFIICISFHDYTLIYRWSQHMNCQHSSSDYPEFVHLPAFVSVKIYKKCKKQQTNKDL